MNQNIQKNVTPELLSFFSPLHLLNVFHIVRPKEQFLSSPCIDIVVRMTSRECRATCGLIVIDADPVQLEVAVSVVGPRWVDAMFIADHFPELRARTHSIT